eukprot:gene12222-14312_t
MSFKTTSVLLCFTLLATVAVNCSIIVDSNPPAGQNPTTVFSPSGIYKGVIVNESISFLGIPYAQPPVGPLRFKPPVAKPFQWGVNLAQLYAPSCWQSDGKNTSTYSEDCLYVNVNTPLYQHREQGLLGSNLPVMVFIHGGRYWTGAATDFPMADMSAVGNVVTVSLQYRLNIFGFQSFDGNTNNGLLDQQLALKWVKDNIRAFGGDPQRITIFGESAGGSSVLYHLLNPASFNYYTRGIIESSWQFYIPTAQVSRNKTVSFAAARGCANVTSTGAPNYTDILACLRALPAWAITPTTGQSDFFAPMIDGKFIDDLPLNSLKNGLFNTEADIIIGHNYDEGNYMAYARLGFKPPNATIADITYTNALNKYLAVYFTPAQAAQIYQLYEPVRLQYGNWYGAAQFFGDYYIECGSILAASYLVDHGAKVRSYIFNYTSTNYPANQWFNAASHGNELTYIFYHWIYTKYDFNDSDYHFADRMIRAWTDFADTGNPISPLSRWPSPATTAMYYGPVASDTDTTVPYAKPICENWRAIFEQQP